MTTEPSWREGTKNRLRRVPGYRFARFVYRLLRNGETRSVALLEWRRPQRLFQPYPTTAENRYPNLFEAVRQHVGDGVDRRVMSFGCATGEEVWSLRRHFATAEIVGIDINPRNIAICRTRLRREPDPGVRFVVAGAAGAEPAGSFDAIFAMAVFRHGALNTTPPPPRCDHLIRFVDFDAAVAELARCLRPGGLLAIRHAQFRFSDTSSYLDFEVVEAPVAAKAKPVFGPDDRLLPDVSYDDALFRKRADRSD